MVGRYEGVSRQCDVAECRFWSDAGAVGGQPCPPGGAGAFP